MQRGVGLKNGRLKHAGILRSDRIRGPAGGEPGIERGFDAFRIVRDRFEIRHLDVPHGFGDAERTIDDDIGKPFEAFGPAPIVIEHPAPRRVVDDPGRLGVGDDGCEHLGRFDADSPRESPADHRVGAIPRPAVGGTLDRVRIEARDDQLAEEGSIKGGDRGQQPPSIVDLGPDQVGIR